jgi:DNA-binding NarL/FixJ family response regulator
MIVDDNQSFLKSARNLLEREGLEVVGVAADGESALAAAGTTQPDVALVDVDLGDESGAAVAGTLLEAHPGLRVILISAYPAEDLPGVLERTPATGFIHKQQLSRSMIEEVLGGEGS